MFSSSSVHVPVLLVFPRGGHNFLWRYGIWVYQPGWVNPESAGDTCRAGVGGGR